MIVLAPLGKLPSVHGKPPLHGSDAEPTTTKDVFFDTEPATLPPREVIASAAESRV